MSAKTTPKRDVNRVPIAVIIGIAIIAILVVASLIQIGRPRVNTDISSAENPFSSLPTGIGVDGLPYAGDLNSPIQVVLYEDFGCHNCKQFFDTIENGFIEAYVKTGYAVLVSNPIAFVNQMSIPAAEAAECALAQDKYWEFRQLLFQNQGVSQFSRDALVEFAVAANLDPGEFRSCYDLGRYTSRVRERTQAAQTQGVKGTPSFMINGKLYSGILQMDSEKPDFPGFRQIIMPILEEQNQ